MVRGVVFIRYMGKMHLFLKLKLLVHVLQYCYHGVVKTQRTTIQNLMNLVKISFTLSFCIFNWDSLHARLSSHCKEWSCKKMNHKKIKAYRKHVQKETIVKRSLLILDLKLFRSQVNRKYSQRVPGSSCARKKTVDIDILVTSMNDGDRKLM